jgi:precorrin-6Y C5,15-methyltransferase (decarboxylating) CbiT subunit
VAERLVETTLAALPDQSFARLNVLVLLQDLEPARRVDDWCDGETAPAVLGRPEREFRHVRGQITKEEVRAVALAKLRLPGDGVLWDVGAGSGSLAVEAAALMPAGTIWAVERDTEQLDCLRANLGRHGVQRVRVVPGSAPAVLADLPRPDRVFVGGGGALLPAILRCCLTRLASRGRIVVNAATLDSVLDAQRRLDEAGWRSELVQLSVARGRLIGGRTRLEALNPVFILAADPPGVRPPETIS